MIEGIVIDGFSLAPIAGLFAAFVLHATVLLGAVWAIERLGGLKHPAWAELAWRVALFGAFVSAGIEALPTPVASVRDAAPTIVASTPEASGTPLAFEAPSTPSASMPATPTPVREVVAPQRTTSATAALALPLASDAIAVALLLWLLGCAVLWLRMLHQARALFGLRRRVLHEGRPASEALRRTTATLAQDMRLAPPQLRVLPALASPMVLPGVVLLPPWTEGLDAAQQRAMLAHELAHLRRRDPLWRPLQRLALAPLFFHPLAWHALRRLEALAETLCDRAAAERGDARALAECLAECLARNARSTHLPRGAGWALAMVERGDGIVGRVRTLLETSHMTLSTIPSRWRWAAGALALLLLIALPGVMVVTRPGMLGSLFDDHDLSVTISEDGKTQTIRSDLPGSGDRFRLAMSEGVVFADDESDVVRMEAGAKFELSQTHAGTTREIVVAPGPGETLRRTYRVDGKSHAFDAEGRAWLAKAIPDAYRMTGADAGARSRRLLARGGVPLLLEEIERIPLDYARSEYISQLMVLAKLDDAQMGRVLVWISNMDSDYEMRRAMGAVVKWQATAPTTQAALLTAAKTIDSDYERAEWLILAAEKLPVSGANGLAWTEALTRFDSDFERKRSLQALIERGQPRAAALAVALRAMNGMESDFERRSVLETVAATGAPLPDADYLAVVDAMTSDFEKREALQALIRSGAPDLARSRGVLQSARRMGSDFETGEVLEALAAAMPDDKALIDDYRAVTRGMRSDFERSEAEKALDRFYRG